jgi:hypothetical protein
MGVLHLHWVILGTIDTPPIILTKIVQSMVFIEYLHEGNAFLLGFVKVMQYPFMTL